MSGANNDDMVDVNCLTSCLEQDCNAVSGMLFGGGGGGRNRALENEDQKEDINKIADTEVSSKRNEIVARTSFLEDDRVASEIF